MTNDELHDLTAAYALDALAAVAVAALAIGLTTTLTNGGSSNKLALKLSVQDAVATMTVTGLPDAPAGKTYEVWVINGSTPSRAGLFHEGGKHSLTLAQPVQPGAKVAITLEQAGGVDAPTTPVIVSATYSAA